MKQSTFTRIGNQIIKECTAHPNVMTAKLKRKYIRMTNNFKGNPRLDAKVWIKKMKSIKVTG